MILLLFFVLLISISTPQANSRALNGRTRSGRMYNTQLASGLSFDLDYLANSARTTRSGRVYGDFRKIPVIDYDIATLDDAQEICAILTKIEKQKKSYYKRFPPELRHPHDAEKLVIYPHQVRLSKIQKDIRLGRLFVAKSRHQNRRIVAFIKLFLIYDEDEINQIVDHELHAVNTDPRKVGRYKMRYSNIYAFEKEPYFAASNAPDRESAPLMRRIPSAGTLARMNNVVNSPRAIAENPRFIMHPKQTFIYYGGAFTLKKLGSHNLRGIGINTKLQVFALKKIFHDILDDILANRSKELAFVFGQVQDNLGGFNSVRVFIEFLGAIRTALALDIAPNTATMRYLESNDDFQEALQELENRKFTIRYLGFRAYRPKFIYHEASNELEFIDPGTFSNSNPEKKAARGLGQILLGDLQLKGSEYDYSSDEE